MWTGAWNARLAASLMATAAVTSCDDQLIHLGAGPPVVDSGMIGPPSDAAPGEATGVCPHATIAADEVLWIGDSWILTPGEQHTVVRDQARASGALGPSDDYTVAAGTGALWSAIAAQYSMQEATATKPKVLIMDGGTLDTLMANGSADSVYSVASAFNQFLAKVAADGTVIQIIYFLVPELPAVYGVAALRPLLQQACLPGAVPACYFLDLQPLWAGHPEYTMANGILPTDAGAQVMASAIWSAMQANCVAQ